MESKVPIFISIAIIFLPLLLFADKTNLYLVISFFIVMIISIENILFALKSTKNKELLVEIEKMKSDLEGKASLNLNKLELGFKTAKVIFITTFVISILFILENNMYITAMTVLVLFFLVVELKHHGSSKKQLISLFSSITNLLYLAVVVIAKYLM